MVRDSVQFVLCHTSLQKNVNGKVEPWSLVTTFKTLIDQGKTLLIKGPWNQSKGKPMVTKGKDLGDQSIILVTGVGRPNM